MRNQYIFHFIIITLILSFSSDVLSQCENLLTSYIGLDKNPVAKNTHTYSQGVFSKGTPNYISEVNGQKVFLLHKTIIMNQEKKLLKTINWMKRLSDLKVSPPFLGLALVKGTRHFVSRFIYPSILFKPLNNEAMSILEKSIKRLKPSDKILLIEKWVLRLKEIQKVLEQEKIMTIDLQFLATLEGEVYIIDPDLYQPASESSDFEIQNKEFELIYEYFRVLIAQFHN